MVCDSTQAQQNLVFSGKNPRDSYKFAMPDLDLYDIIDFIKHLKRGFDKDLFQSKLEELAHVAETTGIEADDFHTLFKLWLNLSIPITKWIALGSCLVPQDRVEERSVDYAFRWLLANCEIHVTSYSRMAFLLDWLTAAMDSDSIDKAALDSGYEIIYSLLGYELLTPHALKLVYNLTKPTDVTRKRALELMDYARKREAKKNNYRQIQVLLGLFKSYRPESVPEDVPAISIHTSFRKINPNLLMRFKRSQERRNITTKDRQHLLWTNPLNEGGKNKKLDPLVPNMEFHNLLHRIDNDPKFSQVDFSDPVSLIQHVLQTGITRPSRLRTLLCNETGMTLLAICNEQDQAFHRHDLHHLLTSTFLEQSPHSVSERADFLRRLAVLQRTLLQPVGGVTHFLAHYLPFWNEMDYEPEILALVEWVSAESASAVSAIVQCLGKAYCRAGAVRQCAIMRALTTMYRNLVFSSTRARHHFLPSHPASNYALVLPSVADAISHLCQKGLQPAPEDIRILYSSLQAAESCALSSLRGSTVGSIPRPLALALPLVTPSAAAIDKVAALLLLYKKIFSQMKAANKTNDESYIQQRKFLEKYATDFVSCLYHDQALTARKSGIVFEKIHPQLIAKLSDLFPSIDSQFSLRNSLAFAAYTYAGNDVADATNEFCFSSVSESFPNLSRFLVRAVPELRG